MEKAGIFAVASALCVFLFRVFESEYILLFALAHLSHEIEGLVELLPFVSTSLLLFLFPSLFLLTTAYLHIFRRSNPAFFASLIIAIGMVAWNGYVLAQGHVLSDALKTFIYVGMFASPICYAVFAYILFRNRFYDYGGESA